MISILRSLPSITLKTAEIIMERRKGPLGQIPVYLKTCARIFVNEKQWKKIIFGLIISIVVSAVCDDAIFSRQGQTKTGCFALITACIWIGIFNSIQAICRERAIIKREHRTGMYISSYILARSIFEFGVCFAQAVIMSICFGIFHGNDIPDDGVLLSGSMEFFITFFLVLFAADMLAMAVSSFCHTENTAMTVMPFILIVQLIFSTLLFQFDNDGVKYFTLSYFGATSMYITSNMNQQPSEKTILTAELTYKQSANSLSNEQIYTILKNQPYDEEYDFDSFRLLSQWMALLIHTVIYIAAAIVALQFVDKDKR